MFESELRKLSSNRIICLIIAGLYIAFVLIFGYSMVKKAENSPPKEEVDRLFELYIKDPEYVESVIADRDKKIAEYYEMTKNMSEAQVEALGPLVFDDVFSNSGKYSDTELIAALSERIEYCESYNQKLSDVISRAESNIRQAQSSGQSADDYFIKSQSRIKSAYQNLLESVPAVGFEYISGWDSLFLSSTADQFMVMTVILLSVTAFSCERESGIIYLLYTSKKGRGRTAALKVFAVFLCSSAVALIYCATTALIIAATVGYSSGLNYIQSISALLYSPLPLTMFGFLTLSVVIRILALFSLSALVLLVSLLLKRSEIIYSVGFGAYFAGFILSFLSDGGILSRLSFYSLMNVSRNVSKAEFFDLLGIPVGSFSFSLFFFAILTAVSITLCCFVYTHNRIGMLRGSGIKKLFEKARKTTPVRRAQRKEYNTSLFVCELHKAVIASRLFLVFAVLIVISAALSFAGFDNNISQTEKLYDQYIEKVHGAPTPENEEYIENEGRFIAETLEAFDKKENEFFNGKISGEEYSAYLNDYYYASSHYGAWKMLNGQKEYISRVTCDGGSAWYIRTKGWDSFFNNGYDLTLVLLVLILSCSAFAAEYSVSGGGCFAPVLRCTKKGRRQTFVSKLMSAALCAILGALLFSLCELAIFRSSYGIGDLDAPIASVMSYYKVSGSMTVGGYLILRYVSITAGCLILALIGFSVSVFTKNTLASLGICTALFYIPGILQSAGLKSAAYMNLSLSADGDSLWLTSFEYAENSGELFLLGIISFSLLIILSSVALIVSYRKFTRYN